MQNNEIKILMEEGREEREGVDSINEAKHLQNLFVDYQMYKKKLFEDMVSGQYRHTNRNTYAGYRYQ